MVSITNVDDCDPVEKRVAWIFVSVLASTIVGALVPLFWIGMQFLFFNAPNSPATEWFYKALYITCPVWLLPGWSVARMCCLNGLLYGSIASVIAILLLKVRSNRKRGRGAA
jgi:hypothetical protein